jgi:magnesium transporter
MNHVNTNPSLIEDLLENRHVSELRAVLNTWLPRELVELVSQSSTEKKILIFSVLSPELAARTFEYLPFRIQQEIINQLPSEKAANLLNELSPDDRTAFLEELPQATVNELLKLLSTKERSLTLKLLGYPENSVGRLMTPDYLAVKIDWTIQEVLDYIRKYGRDSETIDFIYVIDDKGHLIDDLKIREFLLASPHAQVKDLADHKFIALSVNDDDDIAINLFRKYNRVALPVTDAKGILIGIVTIDDILALADKRDTEEVQRIGGTVALDAPYMETSFFQLMKKRASWLVLLFLGETLTATAMGYFQGEIAKAVVLTLFLPLIISSGGNSGSQASTLIIRAMALNEVSIRDWWKIMKREALAGIFLGSILGAIGLLRITTWSLFTDIYGPHWFLIGLTVCFALIGVVIWGTISGSMFPLLLRCLGFDPATASAPFVATLVDVTGVVIYFYIAFYLLHGSLL